MALHVDHARIPYGRMLMNHLKPIRTRNCSRHLGNWDWSAKMLSAGSAPILSPVWTS